MRVRSKKSKKTGTLRFIGQIEPLPAGYWCGVELDDESGTKLLKFLKAGPAEWSDVLDSEGAQKDICSDMCDADEL